MKSPMKEILVPCDFSAPARQAYKFAIELASAAEGEVLVLHTILIPMLFETTFGVQPYSFDALQMDKLDENVREAFARMKKAHPAPDNVPVRFFPQYDYLLPGIRSFVEDNDVDLIVMGTNGSSGLEEFFIGSNTEKVVRFSPVPVIALRKAPFFSSIKNIVLPNNLELTQTEFMDHVKSLQKFFDAKLHILLVNTPSHFKKDQEAMAAMHEFAKFYKLENFTTNLRNSSFEPTGIIDFAHEIKADILAMATHGRRGLTHLFVENLTESVVNHIDCPIWTFSLRKK